MKRILRVILLIFILLILLPSKIFAVSVDSGFIGVRDTNVSVSLGDSSLTNIAYVLYDSYQNSKVKGYEVNAILRSGYSKTIDIKIILKLYDSAKNVLITYDDVFTLKTGERVLYDKTDRYNGADNISYYSFYMELLTDVKESKQEKIKADYYVDNIISNIFLTEDRKVQYNDVLNVKFESTNYFFNYYIPVKQIYLLEDLNFDHKSFVELEKGVNKVRLGSRDKKLPSSEVFKVSYTYDLGKDYNRDEDVVEFDLINAFDNLYKGGKFTIILPKEEGIENIGFYLNGKKEELEYNKTSNRITGKISKLKTNDVLSVKITFNDGYFLHTNSIIDMWLKLGLVLPIASLLVIIIIFLLIRDKKLMTKSVDMDLISKYSSLEVGYLYNDKLDNKDIISMLLSLANKGYVKIEKNKNGFVLHKVKDYDGDNEFEKDFLDGVFYENTVIKEEQLYYMDSSFMDDIRYNINSKYKNKFYNNYFNKYLLLIIACYVSLFIITYRPLVVFDTSYLLLGVGLSLLLFTLIFVVVNSNFKLIERIIGYLSITVFYVFLAYFVILPSLKVSNLYIFIYIIGMLCIAGSLVLYRMIPKRKPSSNKLLRNINRLKKDIESNGFVNKELFLHLLPYTYAIDCYDKFTNVNVCENVSWYDDKNYVYLEFVNDIKTLLANVTYDLTHNDKNGVNR